MIRINSQPIQSSLPDKTPLLNLLRDELGLAGAKLGCGEGECGACMVLVDGRPQTSCNLPLWAVKDHDITTLEGLGSAERPHALQEAFMAENAGQCGYCLSGILVSASALLQHTPRPTSICAAVAPTSASSGPFSVRPRPSLADRRQHGHGLA